MVEGLSGKFGMGRGTLLEVWDVLGTLPEV